MARMPFGTTGGKLHNVCPTSGRFGTETVAERQQARNRTGTTGQQQQQQQGDGCSTPDCKGIAVRYWGMRIGEPADITDTNKCRSCQSRNQQQGG